MVTHTVEMLAQRAPDSGPGPLYVLAGLLVDGGQLRLIDTEKHTYRVDVRDPRFCPENLALWPLKPSAEALVQVEVGWVLSTVVVQRIVDVSLHFPPDTEHQWSLRWPS